MKFLSLKNNHSESGLTLVEVLVATAIFVITIVIAMDLFMIFVRNNWDEVSRKRLEDQMTFVFEFAGDEIQKSLLDYPSFPASMPSNALYLTDENGQKSIIALGGDPAIATLGGTSDVLYTSDYVNLSPITSESISVTKIRFYIYPSADPFDLTTGVYPNNQPTVVMYMKAEDQDDSAINLEYQTMITARYYGR